jgi:hypothetical protein
MPCLEPPSGKHSNWYKKQLETNLNKEMLEEELR